MSPTSNVLVQAMVSITTIMRHLVKSDHLSSLRLFKYLTAFEIYCSYNIISLLFFLYKSNLCIINFTVASVPTSKYLSQELLLLLTVTTYTHCVFFRYLIFLCAVCTMHALLPPPFSCACSNRSVNFGVQ